MEWPVTAVVESTEVHICMVASSAKACGGAVASKVGEIVRPEGEDGSPVP